MLSVRKSGILLHPTSLPGPFGIGDLGPAARAFADMLHDSGQRVWQMLPLGHISYGNSPYMSVSAFAGNPFLISPECLLAEGLLSEDDFFDIPQFADGRVDFSSVIPYKIYLLQKAYARFRGLGVEVSPEYAKFREDHAFWLDEYALFVALKDHHGGRSWTQWEPEFALRRPEALERCRRELADEIGFWKFVQFEFFRQWLGVKSYCHEKGITVIGDMPIYVAHDSAEVWSDRELFYLDKAGEPLVVAGVPPDYFCATGQRWGNPIYRWDVMADRGFHWWVERFKMNFTMFDMVRLDHFRGFEGYWEIPARDDTAVHGRWVPGPGKALFDAVSVHLGSPAVIAEDLGVITPEVDSLREELGFPGMRILQMAFGTDPKASEYLPHNHIFNCVVYTATHDHNTTVGWFTAEPGSQSTQTPREVAAERDYVGAYFPCEDEPVHWKFVRAALASTARLALFPMQDVLGLDGDCRMNMPGRPYGNWEWRMIPGGFSQEIAAKLREMTRIYQRC
jgi:4-alpha-glucanotransferase